MLIWNKLTENRKTLCVSVFLALISVITHHYVFTQKGILSSGDWVHFYPQAANSLGNYAIYIKPHNFGEVMSLPNNWPFYLVASKLMLSGYSFDFFTRMFFLVPIVLFTPVFSLLVFKKITGNLFAAFFASLIYCYSTFFLKLQLDWITYASMWWVLALLVYLSLTFVQTKKSSLLPVISVVIALGIVYELRIMLVICAFLGIYLLNMLLTKQMKAMVLLLASFLLGVLLHSFWLIPLMFGNMYADIISYASSTPFPSFFNIVDVLLLRSYQWNGGLVYVPFVKQKVDTLYFIIPLFAIMGLYARSSYRFFDKAFTRTILISLILFVFLSKQANIPGTEIYDFLFKNAPLFSLFRESSKFIIIVAFCLSIFFGVGVGFAYSKFINRKKTFGYVLALVLGLAILSSTNNYIDSSVGEMTKGVYIPKEYLDLTKLLNREESFYRVFWYPFKPRFAYYSEKRPYVLQSSIRHNLVQNDLFANPERLSRFLDYSSVKYIIVPMAEEKAYIYSPQDTRYEIEGFKDYGSRGKYVRVLQKLGFLTETPFSNNDIKVYQNNDALPNIYKTKEPISLDKYVPAPKLIKYTAISPYLYEIELSELKDGDYLHFSDTFNRNWQLIGTPKTEKVGIRTSFVQLPAHSHIKNQAGLNTFKVNKDWLSQVNRTYENPTIYIYYKPQYYLNLGIFVSIFLLMLTLAVFFSLLIMDVTKYDFRKMQQVIRRVSGRGI
jgi:hypothetical protein